MSIETPAIPSAGEPLEETVARSRHGAWSFVGRRVLAGVLTLVVVSMLVFGAVQALPGNVAAIVLGRNATPAEVAKLNHQLNLDQPLYVRYLDWAKGMLHGELGNSSVGLAQGLPNPRIWPLISSPMKNTAILAGLTILILIPLSLFLGVIGARYADRFTDHSISVITLIFISLPEFVVGSVLILIFFTAFNLLPPVTLVAPGASPLDDPTAMVLPVLTLLLTSLAWTTRLVRVGMLEVLRSDYIRSARLNGFREGRVVWRDALRNGLAPSIQVFALTIQYLVGGVIVTEAVFSYPGIGTQLVNAVLSRDVTEVQAIAVMIAVIYLAINIIADVLVVVLVPKLRTSL